MRALFGASQSEALGGSKSVAHGGRFTSDLGNGQYYSLTPFCVYDSKTDIQGIIGCICLASPDPACEAKASKVINKVFPTGKTGFE